MFGLEVKKWIVGSFMEVGLLVGYGSNGDLQIGYVINQCRVKAIGEFEWEFLNIRFRDYFEFGVERVVGGSVLKISAPVGRVPEVVDCLEYNVIWDGGVGKWDVFRVLVKYLVVEGLMVSQVEYRF